MTTISARSTQLIEKILTYHKISVPFEDLLSKHTFLHTSHGTSANPVVQQSYHIDTIPPEGIVLNKCGCYEFTKDIDWNPTDNVAITLSADNIVLDLGGFTLKSLDQVRKTVAIHGQNIKNVKIINGTLLNFVFKGINIDGYSNVVVKDIVVDGLSWKQIGDPNVNTPVGVFLTDGTRSTIKRVTVKNIEVKTDSSAAIQVVQSDDVFISKCKVENYVNQDGSVQGFSTILVENGCVKYCRAYNLESFFNGNIETAGHTVLGFIPIFCFGMHYTKCKAANLFGCCDDVHGMSIFINSYVTVRHFKARNVIDGFSTNVGAKATGLEIYGSNIKIYDSHVKDIKAINPQDLQATGFSSAQGSNIKYIRCKAENVIVVDEFGKENSCLGYGTGFGWAPDPRPLFTFPIVNVLYLDCVAKNCQVGFDSWYHIDSRWENIVSYHCGISILNLVNSVRTLTCTPCSECIIPLVTTLNNVAKGNKFRNVKAVYSRC